MKIRADILLSRMDEVKSREEAQALIMAGQVYAGEKRVNKASEMFEEETVLRLRGPVNRLASRGYHKLEKGLRAFEAATSKSPFLYSFERSASTIINDFLPNSVIL